MKRIATPANIIIFLVSLFAMFRLEAQVLTSADLSSRLEEYLQTSPWEEVYLHIDRDKYVAGENIWFSIYSIDRQTGRLSDKSAIAYVELLNPWNIPLIQARFQLSGGRGKGNFLLPDSISSGTYTIRAYTNWMKNFLPSNCFIQDIDIYNPFKSSVFMRKGGFMNNLKIKETITHHEKSGSVTLTADSIFGRREKVTLKLGTGNYYAGQSGNYDMSISVTPAEVCKGSQGIEDYMLSKKPIWEDTLSGIKAPLRYSYETNGHYLSGIVKYREGSKSDSSEFLFMSIQGKVAEFKYARIDTAGRFKFILPVDNKTRNLILQPDHANNNMILEIETSFSWLLPGSYSFKDTFSDSQLSVFSGLSFNYQAEKIYGINLRKESEVSDNSNLKARRFYGIPEMEVFLDDYIKLPVMQEVFFELLPGVIFRSRKSGYEIKITNPLTGMFYDDSPLVMIDGVIINDLNVLADLNPEIVEKIEVVKTPYLIGDLILHGIVNVITRSGDFSNITMPEYAVLLPYRVIDEPSTFIAPDYSDKQNMMSRTPDLRNTLYWNPSMKSDRNGEAEIEFWTSDLPGIYSIIIQGVSGTGEKVSLFKSFIVR